MPLTKEGVKGFKCFLIESGVDEFPCVDEKQVLTAMAKLDEAKSLFLFHAELESSPTNASTASESAPDEYSTFLDSRPESLEIDAISLIERCARQYPSLRTHIVHLSASSALPILRSARAKGLPMTVETCFHYLTLTAESVPRGSTLHKCCPPIRSESNRDKLWQALIDGDIDFVVSDHSPCTTELKRLESGDFMKAWGGIGGLGLGLSLMWTEARQRKVGMERVIEWCAERPAKQVGLNDRKGSIRVGNDADFVVFDPELSFTVRCVVLHLHDAELIVRVTGEQVRVALQEQSKPIRQVACMSLDSMTQKTDPASTEGMRLTGAVLSTYLRAEKVYDRTSGLVRKEKPLGRLLL